jgi:glycosyltransferase involved in cell wall biosynthesis
MTTGVFSRVKVVIISGYPLSGKRSGALVHIEKLAEHLSEVEGMEVHVITSGNNVEQFENEKVTVHVMTLPLFILSLLFPFSQWSIMSKIKKLSPDILHAAGTFPYTTIVAMLRKKYPAIITVFSLSKNELRWEKNIVRIIKKVVISIPNERYVIKRIGNIIVQSSFTERKIENMTDAKIHIIPEGIECGEINQLQLHDMSESPDIFIAVLFRKLKGLDVLIRAVGAVQKIIPNIQLYIAGNGEEEHNLQNLVNELNIQHCVKFLGYVSSKEEIYSYYKACKVVVVPSRWDIEPFAAIDGAMFGKPIIATKSCNSSLVIDGVSGFMIESEDVDTLTNRLVLLLSDKSLRDKLGKAAKEKSKEYDWPKIADNVTNVYRMTMNEFYNIRRD